MVSQYERFFYWLGQLTSGDIQNPSGVDPKLQYRKIENPVTRTGRVGKYQMTENQLARLGYYVLAENDNGLSNRWRGSWTGRRGIKSLDDFLNNQKGQEFIIREAMRGHWRLIRRNHLDELVGTKAHGVLLTESTLLAIAHLMGDEGVVALAPKGKAFSDIAFGAVAVVSGFQTPYDVNPNQNPYQEQFERFLADGTPITLNGDLSKIAREDVEEYTWCTQGDDRVRESHAVREGEMCNIGDSPEPGEEENCRCWKEGCVSDSCNALAYDQDGAIQYLSQEAQALEDWLNAHGKPSKFGNRRCAHNVAEAIEKGGKVVGGERPQSAKDFGSWLKNNGFVQVASWQKGNGSLVGDYVAGYAPKAGDTVVIQASAGHLDGHMAMYDGSKWVSDFVQSDIWGGSVRKATPDYIIYRHR